MSTKAGFIGLGVMGFPMAGHLASAGYEMTVFNRSSAKSERWQQQYGGEIAENPALLAQEKAFVFCCVGNDDDLYEVALGKQGAFQAMAPGSVFVDHTTASASLARGLAAEAKARGFHFLDAPVSGGQSGAEKGQLTVMIGGEAEAYARVEKVIGCYAKNSRLLGEPGSGQLCKMVNQICVAGIIQGLA
ncbi:MAG: NAD(P)-dependent oxidoreductase, partial [Pseudomonadales bacterium]|nr:NAD(P)-dependent oxidoreductase [Pseudomonadales bacterium]